MMINLSGVPTTALQERPTKVLHICHVACVGCPIHAALAKSKFRLADSCFLHNKFIMSFNVESLCVIHILTPGVPSCHSFHSDGHCCICPSQAGIIVDDTYIFLRQSERLLHLSLVMLLSQDTNRSLCRFFVTVVLISSFTVGLRFT